MQQDLQISACEGICITEMSDAGSFVGGVAFLCFRAQITLSLRRLQARQQDLKMLVAEPIKTPKQWMDASSAHIILQFMHESRVVTCGLPRD